MSTPSNGYTNFDTREVTCAHTVAIFSPTITCSKFFKANHHKVLANKTMKVTVIPILAFVQKKLENHKNK